MNDFIDPFGRYGLMTILRAIPLVEEDEISAKEQLHYYQEAINYGDSTAVEMKEIVEEDMEAIKEIQCELKFYLMIHSN